jgi:hypothetical protein
MSVAWMTATGHCGIFLLDIPRRSVSHMGTHRVFVETFLGRCDDETKLN